MLLFILDTFLGYNVSKLDIWKVSLMIDKEKVISGAVGAVVAAVILSVVTTVATKTTGLVENLFEPAIPDGAIVALSSPCNNYDGWEDYADGAGKFLLGAGTGVLRPQGPHAPLLPDGTHEINLSTVNAGDQGGEEKHRLLISEMPIHKHQVSTFEWGHTINGNNHPKRIDVDDGEPWPPSNGLTGRLETDTRGENMPHNNMPPYIAVYFCKKEGLDS